MIYLLSKANISFTNLDESFSMSIYNYLLKQEVIFLRFYSLERIKAYSFEPRFFVKTLISPSTYVTCDM